MKSNRFFIIAVNLFKALFKLNLIKTIYFNFKVLPFHQAVKLPIHFFGKTEFANLTGEFTILSSEIHFGMIMFGSKHEVVISSNMPTRIYNSGSIEFTGTALFARGINIMVWDKGTLSIGENFSIGSLSRIICFRNIQFGNQVLISWECQFFDTDFHFIVSKENQIADNCGEVQINDGVWIGARATILKNTVLSRNSIVAAQSLCSGDYLEKYGEGTLLAGIPAKMIKSEVKYLQSKKKELELFEYFSVNPNTNIKTNE